MSARAGLNAGDGTVTHTGHGSRLQTMIRVDDTNATPQVEKLMALDWRHHKEGGAVVHDQVSEVDSGWELSQFLPEECVEFGPQGTHERPTVLGTVSFEQSQVQWVFASGAMKDKAALTGGCLCFREDRLECRVGPNNQTRMYPPFELKGMPREELEFIVSECSHPIRTYA